MIFENVTRSILSLMACTLLISCSTVTNLHTDRPPLSVEKTESASSPSEESDAEAEDWNNKKLEEAFRSLAVLAVGEHPDTHSKLVDIPVVVRSESMVLENIPTDSPIVITNIQGRCATTVTDALMRRLVNNSNHDVVTREYLGQIIGENDRSRNGLFDTTTAAQLGRFKAANLFIVGKVIYCSDPRAESKGSGDGDDWDGQFDILAVLQLLNTETGEVILSSAPRGVFTPNFSPRVVNRNPGSRHIETASGGGGDGAVEVDFPELGAADDLANDFANTLFGRPSWESLLMWRNSRWNFSEVVNYVKLGRCEEAVAQLDSLAVLHFEDMEAFYVAEYLHNYGVALLCNNEPQKAMGKLRASYRLAYREDTLKMLDLAGRVVEWDLHVEVETEPEIRRLAERQRFLGRLDP